MTRIRPYIVAALLMIQASLLAIAAALHSPAGDEVAHLAAGVADWELASFGLYKVNPPLVRMLAAAPVVLAGAKTDYGSWYAGPGARPEFAVMYDFARANGPRLIWLVTLSRWALIPLVLLGGYICYRWALELYGDLPGILAIALWCFCPNVLGYGNIITADAGAASLGVAASYLFWKWLRAPTWDRAIIAGAALGLAELTKTTWVVLFPLWPVVWAVWQWTARRGGSNSDLDVRSSGGLRHLALQLIAIEALALLCINLGYGFEGSGTRVRDYEFVSRSMAEGGHDAPAIPSGNRFVRGWLGGVRIPLPKSYVEGIDLQWHDIEVGKPSYMRGQWRQRGWWQWYLYALAVKIALGTWGLSLLAVGVRAIRSRLDRPKWRDELVLLAPAITVLVLVSSQTGFSRYFRYVLPALPFAFIWISSVAKYIGPKRWKLAVATFALLVWSVGSSLWYAPHWLSYFNEAAGGPMGGPRHLIDAQVDWGQDLLYLKRWLDSNPKARPLGLVYFGPIDPRICGLECWLPQKGTVVTRDWMEVAGPPDSLMPGWYAVSVNHLYGYPHFVHDMLGGRQPVGRPYYSYFRRFEPVATAGYSIYIYHLTDADLKAARSPRQRGDD